MNLNRAGFLARLAWKLVWGRPGRAWLAIASIAVGTAVILLVLSGLAGFEQYLLDRATGTLLGDLVVTSAKSVAERRTGDVFDPRPVLEAARVAGASVRAAAPRLVVPVLVGSEGTERAMYLYGLDATHEMALSPDVRGLESLATTGTTAETAPPRVLLSDVEAEALHVRPGSIVELIATDRFGVPRAARAEVAGLYRSASRDVEAFAILGTLELAGELLDARGLVHEVGLGLAPEARALDRLPREAVTLAGRLGEGAPRLTVQPWTQVAPAIVDYVRINVGVYNVFLAVQVLLVALAVADILWLGLEERMRDMGTLGALGARRRGLAAVVLLQAGWLTGLGLAIGVVVGRAYGTFIERVGIPGLDAAAAFSVAGFSIGEGLKGRFEPSQIPIAIGLVLVASGLAVLLPVRRALALEPVEILRHR